VKIHLFPNFEVETYSQTNSLHKMPLRLLMHLKFTVMYNIGSRVFEHNHSKLGKCPDISVMFI